MRSRPSLQPISILASAMVLLVVSCATGLGKPPWQLVSFRRVEADPQKTYELTEEAGPWLIFAASFAGEGASTEARDLMMELRKQYKLPAYVHSQRFDFTHSVEGIGINPDLTPKKMKYDKSQMNFLFQLMTDQKGKKDSSARF